MRIRLPRSVKSVSLLRETASGERRLVRIYKKGWRDESPRVKRGRPALPAPQPPRSSENGH